MVLLVNWQSILMSLKKKIINTECLKIGMYVSELDMPWLDSPFKYQGFIIEHPQHISEVNRVCQHVTIDLEKGLDDVRLQHSLASNKTASPIRRPVTYPRHYRLDQELETARQLYTSTRQCVDSVMEAVSNDREIDIANVRKVIKGVVDSIIRNPDALVCMTQLKTRDEYTAQHSLNVCILTLTLGRHLGMDIDSLNMLGTGALLHDIGKLKTPLEILNKPDRLSDEEFSRIKEHPQEGHNILRQIPDMPNIVSDIALSHHEREGGQGYPNGLTGDQISFWSKLVSIVDVYDAITSDRCYHKGMSPTDALTRLYGWRGTDFAPDLVEQFIQCLGIYPIGSIVELNTAEIAIVITNEPRNRLLPKIEIILDPDKNPVYAPRIIDLANQDEQENSLRIMRTLENGALGINVTSHLKSLRLSEPS